MLRAQGTLTRHHYFGFRDCCLVLSERTPADSGPRAESPTIFFLHGRYGQAENWKTVIGILSTRFRCIAIDLPGFGRSYSPRAWGHSLLEHSRMVQALVERLAPGGAILVGHDVGGAIAQLCVMGSPQLARALVLINSAALTQKPGGLRSGPLGLMARIKLGEMTAREACLLGRPDIHQLCAPWKNRAMRQALGRAFEAWDGSWPGLAQRSVWRRELRQLPHPVLVLWGCADPLNRLDYAAELLREIPEAYLYENERCGHWPHLEASSWVADKMSEFLFRVGQKALLA